MTPLWWSIALAAIGILGIWLAGRKNLWGWAIGVAAQVLWIVYAVATQQWGFIASALAYAAVYAVNWRKWAVEGRKGVRIAPAAAPLYPMGNTRPRHGVVWDGRRWRPTPGRWLVRSNGQWTELVP